MRTINDQLGYQPSDTYQSWDLDVEAARRKLRPRSGGSPLDAVRERSSLEQIPG
jgi:hypothetical protein